MLPLTRQSAAGWVTTPPTVIYPLFYPMLIKALVLPLLPDWSDYLWQNGRQHRLITLLDDGQGQGYAAWQVKPAPSIWQEVVQSGLQAKAIAF